MSVLSNRTSKATAFKKEAKANFAWRSGSVETPNRIREHFNWEPKDSFDFDKATEDWRILLDDSDDSTLGWGQNSSSSSTSWLDDLESEATTRLQTQLNILDKLVFGEDLTKEEAAVPIPSELLEEATLWRTSYPHLRVKGVPLSVPQQKSKCENIEEVIASHSVTDDFDKESNESLTHISSKTSSKVDDSIPITEKRSSDLKANVMKKLFDHLWPDVLECVKCKIPSCPRDTFKVVNNVDSLPNVTDQQYMTSAKALQRYQNLANESKFGITSLEVPERYMYRSRNQTARDNSTLDSILKVSPLPLKRPSANNVPSQVIHKSYHVLSSRGQTHLISNCNNHLTLPPIEVPTEPVRGNSFEGSFSHLRSTSALSRDHHQLSSSRPNTSTLLSAQDNILKSSFMSVSPSNLTKNLSFNVLGKHLPANSNLPWYKSCQKKVNNVHR